ncbi:hypothetical protein IAD21_01879 [Abditibacteriota bacterium]|nr:hypothetical protein IAD21_01879 [Abditibacteriota bacterium]
MRAQDLSINFSALGKNKMCMDYSSHIVGMTRSALETLFRTARATPEDKLTWKPNPDVRSILEVLQDAAQRSLMFAAVMKGEARLFTTEMFPVMAQERAQWTSLEQCEAKAREGLEAFYEVLLATDDFDSVLTMPFGGHQLSKANFSLMPLQSLTYMNGQVNYIQTLYGDYDRH